MGREHRTIVSDYLKKAYEFGVYNRYSDISDRQAWDGLPFELKEKIVEAGLKAQSEPWSQLLISDFLEFSKSGNRVRFEDKYFPRRRKLNKLVMAECVENKGRFLDDILDGLYLILEETTWCLPPHTSYERDGKQEALPDVTRQIIDLFQAESGAEVAFCEYLLRPAFKTVSPNISIYVNERLKERIFEPYLKQHFWWMGDGVQTMCNWTPWIVQNVLICALTREESFFSSSQIGTFLEKAAKSCDYFLDEYGEDGGCNEGAQYYSHAGLCLFGCLELIDGATDRAGKGRYAEIGNEGQVVVHEPAEMATFPDIFREKIIRNIANFIVKMHVDGEYYINFADCSALPGRRTAREFLFGKATCDEVLCSFAAKDFREESDEDKLIGSEINLFYHVMQAFAWDEMGNFPQTEALAEDSWFESMGLMIARDKSFVLAAKAGNNGDSHNHNDVGSFTIYKEGKPFIIDLGVGTYTQKTFSDKRYELWTMQSQFHNLPTFFCFDDEYSGEEDIADLIGILGDKPEEDLYDPGIIMEKDGSDYCASDVSCILCTNMDGQDGRAVSSLKMDIAGAYAKAWDMNKHRFCSRDDENGDNDSFGSYIRTVSLHKERNVTVEDSYTIDAPFVMSLLTYEKPTATEIESEKNYEIKVGNVGTIRIEGAKGVCVEEYPITDERLGIAWKHEVYRILLLADGSHLLRMSFT